MSEPQNGRIGGSVLKDNLLRQGVDLAFETDLLYLKLDGSNAEIISGSPSGLSPTDPDWPGDGDPNITPGTLGVGIGINIDNPLTELHVGTQIGTNELITSTNANINAISISNSNIIANGLNLYLNAATSINLSTLTTNDIRINDNSIFTKDSANLELRPTGSVDIYADETNITGNLHATGNITFGGNLTLGNDNTDTVTFEAEVKSDIIPNESDNRNLGSVAKKWKSLYTNLLNGQQVTIDEIQVNDTSLARRQGNIFYVSTLGNNSNVGDHQHGAFLTLEHALSVVDASSAGPVTIHIYPGTYIETCPLVVPSNVTISGEDVRNVIIKPSVATQSNDIFHLEHNTTIENITIQDFYFDSFSNTGYAFRFAPNTILSERSPYIRNVTVVTKGTVTSQLDPGGFNTGDAGKGAWIDGSELNSLTVESSMLFHAVTFITPGVDCITMTNGVRVEWLNSFTYFANRGLYATQGTVGLGNNGIQYGAELRSINSANVYGNYGVVADGANTLVYLIGHNFAYIGTGKDVSNDNTLSLQDQETLEINNGTIYYVSTDQKGNFRVGDAFFISFENGTTSFDASQLDLSGVSAIFLNTNGSITYIDGQRIDTGNIRFNGNEITTIDGDLKLTPVTGNVVITSNPSFLLPRGTTIQRINEESDIRYNTDTNLYEAYSSSNIAFNGVYSDDRQTNINANNALGNLVFTANNIETARISAGKLILNGLQSEDILFNNNLIRPITLNADLVITPNGIGTVVIDDYILDSTVIENTSNNNLTLKTTGRGFVKFDMSTGLIIPSGSSAERPANPQLGYTRWNSELDFLETYNGTSWARASGEGELVTEGVLAEILDIYTLVLG
tara:strand:+ start:2263 stop:4812 length:2550 start_codon:yes stop_codon:yes gene_type:complete